MKNRKVRRHYQATKIYQQHYRPSYNIFRLLGSVLSMLINGSSAATATTYRRRR
ncbi:MAG TPA: hypothetical protein VMZ03_00045 [Chitinophagaceae bacterium]|nr:hypothetical protein [Chitinophagaceae bacterium]